VSIHRSPRSARRHRLTSDQMQINASVTPFLCF